MSRTLSGWLGRHVLGFTRIGDQLVELSGRREGRAGRSVAFFLLQLLFARPGGNELPVSASQRQRLFRLLDQLIAPLRRLAQEGRKQVHAVGAARHRAGGRGAPARCARWQGNRPDTCRAGDSPGVTWPGHEAMKGRRVPPS